MTNWEQTLKDLHFDLVAAEDLLAKRKRELGTTAVIISDATVDVMMARHKFNAAIAHYMQYLGRQWEAS